MNTGWVCPTCRTVYAPFVGKCPKCPRRTVRGGPTTSGWDGGPPKTDVLPRATERQSPPGTLLSGMKSAIFFKAGDKEAPTENGGREEG